MSRERSIMMTSCGAITNLSTLKEERLGLTQMRQSYRLTGTHPSHGSVSVWKSANRKTLLPLTSRRARYTHSSPMGNTAPPHWVVTHGRSWLAHEPLCSRTATKKGSMRLVKITLIRKQESVILLTKKMIVVLVIPELDLVLADITMTPTRVVTKQRITQITETKISELWDISWCSKLFPGYLVVQHRDQ